MERKFTDGDIIKALGCICGNVLFCIDCPYSKTFNQPIRCKEMCAKDALDLINRQKAEIERLKGMVSQNEGVLPRYEALIKSEAIKEFAERLQEIIIVSKWHDKFNIAIIDNLVKEMTEERNGRIQ